MTSNINNRENDTVSTEVKAFPSNLAHKAALIPDSMARQTPAEAAGPRTRRWCACLPSPVLARHLQAWQQVGSQTKHGL